MSKQPHRSPRDGGKSEQHFEGEALNSHHSEANSCSPDSSTFWQPVDDWTTLLGANVEVYEGWRIVDRGRVEAVTEDGRILWLAQEGASTRRLWETAPGRFVKLAPTRTGSELPLKQLTGEGRHVLHEF
ncbi:hypothetical protein FBY31_0227 [Arthrobacter sp. SLBN-100]|nr:hypothetical protein FBY31_0227 [Arthrobacter sp. SLBN-100]